LSDILKILDVEINLMIIQLRTFFSLS